MTDRFREVLDRVASLAERGALRIGSLFSGYGGLDLGVMSVFGGTVAWHVEFDDAPSRILAHNFPGVANYGDVTKVNWRSVERVHVLTGGFPCQDVSLAGARAGLAEGTRSGLWLEFAKAIDVLRPQLVVIENVRGLLSASAVMTDREMEDIEGTGDLESLEGIMGEGDGSSRPVLRALGAVLGSLAELGYDARWCGVRAADAGAPHNRFRVFILAYADSGRRANGSKLDGHAAEDPTNGSSCGRDVDGCVCAHRHGDVADTISSECTRQPEERTWRDATAGSGRSLDADAANVGHERAGAPRCGWAGSTDGRNPIEDTDSATCCERGESAPREAQEGGAWCDTCGRDRASAADTECAGFERRRGNGDVACASCASETEWEERERYGDAANDRGSVDWGQYAPAIARWEAVTGLTAPPPTKGSGKNGAQRLNPEFTEWMMGLRAGWITSPAIGLRRNEMLKACGNGVVPQQAALALTALTRAEKPARHPWA